MTGCGGRQMLPSERALACELLALFTAGAMADGAAAAHSPFAAEVAASAGAAVAGEPAHALAGGTGGGGGGGPAETLLWLVDAEEEPDLAAGGDRAGADVRAAALARVTPEVYAMLAEGGRARLILVRPPRAPLLPCGAGCMRPAVLARRECMWAAHAPACPRTRRRPVHNVLSLL